MRDCSDFSDEDWWWLAAVLVAVVTTFFVVREGEPPVFVPPDVDDEDYLARPIPFSVLDGPEGPLSVWALCESAARLLVFSHPDEEADAALVDRLPAWQALLGPGARAPRAPGGVAVRRGPWPELSDDVLGDPDGETQARLGVPVPGAVLLGTDRHLAGGPVGGLDEIEELVEAAAEQVRERGALGVGNRRRPPAVRSP